MSWLFDVDQTENWAYWDNAFTIQECELIKSIALKKNKSEGEIFSDQKINYNIRKSKIIWLSEQDEIFWVYEKLAYIVQDLNTKFFKFDLMGFTENLQFTEYNAPDNKYDWHIDRGINIFPRKLSLVIQLTDPKEYEGGELELWYEKEPQAMKKNQGTLILFPSYTLHRAKTVTKGIRHSLVAWIGGKQFI